MTFGIFFGLIGIPVIILATAVICYIIQAERDKDESISVQKEEKGGLSQ